MPIDRYGRVIVNPSVPLGMSDFASLYAATPGQSPEEKATRIFMDSPSEGRSYMENQWSKLGIHDSPERYFADPSHVAAALETVHPSAASAPHAPSGSSPSGTGQWPTFQNEDERNLAINLGTYDPNYTTPAKRDLAITEHARGHSYEEIMSDPEVLKYIGSEPKKGRHIYAALTGGRDFDHDRATYEQRDYAEKLHLRTLTEADARQKEMEDRQGRALDERERRAELRRRDIEREKDYRELERAPLEWGMKRFEQLQEKEAHYDPKTGKLMVWEYQPAADTEMLRPGEEPRPVRKLVPASPENQHIWRKFYPLKMGMPAPDAPVPEMMAAAMAGSVDPLQLVRDPAHLTPSMSILEPSVRMAQGGAIAAMPDKVKLHVQQKLSIAETVKGSPLTAAESHAVISGAVAESKPLFAAQGPSRFGEVADSFMGNVLGYSDWTPNQPAGTVNTPNAWGRVTDAAAQRELEAAKAGRAYRVRGGLD